MRKSLLNLIKFVHSLLAAIIVIIINNIIIIKDQDYQSFLHLHRYVDLTEAIDSGDASFLDTTEFQEADGIPLNDSLPAQHYLDIEV